MIRRSIVIGCGGYLPQRIVTNEVLARDIDTSDRLLEVDHQGIISIGPPSDMFLGKLIQSVRCPIHIESIRFPR